MKEKINEEIIKEFEKRFGRYLNTDVAVGKSSLQSWIEDFIIISLNLALEAQRKEIIKKIKEKGLHLGYANDIIDIINNKND